MRTPYLTISFIVCSQTPITQMFWEEKLTKQALLGFKIRFFFKLWEHDVIPESLDTLKGERHDLVAYENWAHRCRVAM